MVSTVMKARNLDWHVCIDRMLDRVKICCKIPKRVAYTWAQALCIGLDCPGVISSSWIDICGKWYVHIFSIPNKSNIVNHIYAIKVEKYIQKYIFEEKKNEFKNI